MKLYLKPSRSGVTGVAGAVLFLAAERRGDRTGSDQFVLWPEETAKPQKDQVH